MSARELAEKFFGHVEAGEVDEILGMMTPHATEQYGHVLRVSVVLASLNGLIASA